MNLHKSKIEWCTHSWNPVTGCRHGCEYCYARRFIKRFWPHTVERPMPDAEGNTGIIEQPGVPGCFRLTKPTRLADEKGRYTRSTPYPKGFAPTFPRICQQHGRPVREMGPG